MRVDINNIGIISGGPVFLSISRLTELINETHDHDNTVCVCCLDK